MRVTLLAQFSGTRNGKEWPARGAAIDLPAEEAEHLIAGGLAVKASGPVETASAPAAPESAAVDTKPPRRRGGK